jgi:hypothetical protein
MRLALHYPMLSELLSLAEVHTTPPPPPPSAAAAAAGAFFISTFCVLGNCTFALKASNALAAGEINFLAPKTPFNKKTNETVFQ